jgi:hypothetical protein
MFITWDSVFLPEIIGVVVTCCDIVLRYAGYVTLFTVTASSKFAQALQ